jgi:calcineurin-like phosphoesterase family protein
LEIIKRIPRWFFTADYHFDHRNIIKYCNRPFSSVEEMNEGLISNTNKVVSPHDNLVIAGDITLHPNSELVYKKFINKLNGNKIILKGNHDYWMNKSERYIYHLTINKQFIAVSHYPMRSWNRSFHGSWNLHGHEHGTLEPLKNQWDIGVDNNNYCPISFEEITKIITNN